MPYFGAPSLGNSSQAPIRSWGEEYSIIMQIYRFESPLLYVFVEEILISFFKTLYKVCVCVFTATAIGSCLEWRNWFCLSFRMEVPTNACSTSTDTSAW